MCLSEGFCTLAVAALIETTSPSTTCEFVKSTSNSASLKERVSITATKRNWKLGLTILGFQKMRSRQFFPPDTPLKIQTKNQLPSRANCFEKNRHEQRIARLLRWRTKSEQRLKQRKRGLNAEYLVARKIWFLLAWNFLFNCFLVHRCLSETANYDFWSGN